MRQPLGPAVVASGRMETFLPVRCLTMTRGVTGRLSVRLAADVASVPGARRFVVDGLKAWGRGDLADVAELVTSELAGNAALHASAEFMHLTVATGERPGVRVAVEDDGPVGVEVVQPQALAAAEGFIDWSDQAATGRGLAIVAMMSADWGVDVTALGKRVWADLVDAETTHQVRAPSRADDAGGEGPAGELPPDWVLVRLAECPVELSLRQDRHLDELIRELQLLSSDRGNPHSQAVADQIRDLLVSPAHARLTGRRTAERARADGRDLVDVDMAMPRELSPMIEQLQAAVARADELCESGHLLALASPPDLRRLRAWMTHEIVAQADRGAAPLPWPEWERRVDDA